MSGFGAKGEKDVVVDFAKYADQLVRVRFQGGREVEGLLKGYDKLDNLVLDNAVEYLRDPNNPTEITDKTRTLGLVICRGTQVALICPCAEMEEIANPFGGDDGEEEEEENA